MAKKKTSITIDENLLEAIKLSAKRENRSVSQEIEKRLLDFYQNVKEEEMER